jgi:cytochrome c1
LDESAFIAVAGAPAHALGSALAVAGLAAILGCSDGLLQGAVGVDLPGDPAQGKVLVGTLDCGVCHTIPGVAGANGSVGPPLTHFARRSYIAGRLPNQPDNLQRWVLDPPSLVPSTAMPRMPITEGQARDIVAYLYTLR